MAPITLLSSFAVFGIAEAFAQPEVTIVDIGRVLLLTASMLGIASLWVAILTPDRLYLQHRLFALAVTCGLIAGVVVAAVFGCYSYVLIAKDPAPSQVFLPILIFFIPLIVGVRHLRRIGKINTPIVH